MFYVSMDMNIPFASRIRALRARRAASHLVPAKHVVSTVHGNRTVLLDARSGHYYGLDEIGSRIWSLAQDGQSVSSIVETLHREYDVSPEALAADVEAFMKKLHRSRLLVQP